MWYTFARNEKYGRLNKLIKGDVLFYIWLAQCFSYGSNLPAEILRFYGNKIYEFYENVEKESKNFKITAKRLEKLKNTKLRDYEYILQLCERLHIKIVCYTDEEYPKRLREIANAPVVLYYVGNLGITFQPCISVVGTRRCDDYGIKMANNISEKLIEYGITLVSGCATGVDSVVHKAALKFKGYTAAVLGTALEVSYPFENKELKRNIVRSGGLVISEYPPRTKTSPWLFPIRNRIISAICDAVVVVQSPEKSGAVISANLALNYGKKVFCMPPADIFSENASGIKKCLENGATLLLDIKDLLSVYKDSKYKIAKKNTVIPNNKPSVKKEREIPPQFKELFEIVSKEERLTEILKKTGSPANITLSILTQMELLNFVKRTKFGFSVC